MMPAELYEALAQENNQVLELDLEPGLSVRADRDLLFQAVANLLDNALKYTPSGGKIRVCARSRDDAAEIVVTDSGPGIPADARNKALQRFFRLESSRATPGNGLGLSLVAAVAKMHHARLRLQDNEPGLRVALGFSSWRRGGRQ